MTETETSLSRSQKNPRKESEERIRRLKLASHAAPFIYRGGLEAGDVTGSSSPSCPLLSAPPLSASFASMGVDSRRANIAECNGEEKPVSSIHHFNFFIFQFSLSHLPPPHPLPPPIFRYKRTGIKYGSNRISIHHSISTAG